MKSDFPRVISLLRKERGISQKKAAAELGITQARLSHYEKGVRECGLEFLVQVADYYGVSCDYLLGRSPDPKGSTISLEDIPEHDPGQKELVTAGGMMASFNKRLIINSVNVLFSLAQRCESNVVMREIAMFLMLAVYRMFRVVFSANTQNDPRFFTISEPLAARGANAVMDLSEAVATAAAKGTPLDGQGKAGSNSPLINNAQLAEEFPAYSSSLLNLIKNSETQIQALHETHKPPQK